MISQSLPGLHDWKRATTTAQLVKILEVLWGTNSSHSLEPVTWLRDKLLCYLSQCIWGIFSIRQKILLCLVIQSCLTLCDPMDCSPLSSSVHGILQARILEWIAMPSSRGSSQPRDRTQVSHIALDSLPSEPPGKPKTTGVGGLPLLQGTFLTHESKCSLLHCRRILYQLSYQGNQDRMLTIRN